MKYSIELINEARRLESLNTPKTKIAKELGVPRGTVRYWLQNNGVPQRQPKYPPILEHLEEHKEDYAYLLGLYLGDGDISKVRKTLRLRIFLDSKHVEIEQKVKGALQRVFYKNKTTSYKAHKNSNCKTVYVYYSKIDDYFLPGGLGRKHTRPIVLHDWQTKIIKEVPAPFLVGLIHSDGSRYQSRGRWFYNFTNKSKDIIDLFIDTANQLGIKYRVRFVPQAQKYMVEITRKAEVIKLDNIGAVKA